MLSYSENCIFKLVFLLQPLGFTTKVRLLLRRPLVDIVYSFVLLPGVCVCACVCVCVCERESLCVYVSVCVYVHVSV